jgi:hypothetical protein
MKIFKRIMIGFGILFVIAQFIRPQKNIPGASAPHDIHSVLPVPTDIEGIFKTSCADCHTDSTRYPWYAEIEPVGWWLTKHIRDGKKSFNLSAFGDYRLRRQYNKLGDIVEQIDQNEMPLESYLFIHKNAELSKDQRERLVGWAGAMRDSMKAKYPIDSLERRKEPGK